MTNVTAEFEPVRRKPQYWPLREAVEDAMSSIDIKKIVERTVVRMKRKKATDIEIVAFRKKMERFLAKERFYPVKRIIEFDTSGAKGEDPKVTMKLEYEEGLLEDLTFFEAEVLNGAVGRSVEESQYAMAITDEDMEKTATEKEDGSEELVDIMQGRVMKRLFKWNTEEK